MFNKFKVNKMRKLLFFSIATSLFFNTKAQTEIKNFESVPMQKQSIERETRTLFAPTKEMGVLDNYGYSMPEHKAVTYTALYDWENLSNWTKSISFAASGVPDLGTNRGYYVNLFPDSLAFWYQYDEQGTYTGKRYVLDASTGMTFDPYSRSFDNYGINGMLAYEGKYFLERLDSVRTFYGYKLDAFYVLVDYRLPKGYNPDSPDILRFHVCHYGVYDRGADSNEFSSVRYGPENDPSTIRAVSPKYKYPSPIPEKGIGPVVHATNKIVKDYILTDEDTTTFDDQSTYRAIILVDLEDEGYIIPPGHVLSIVVQYIPGFDYTRVDTLTVPEVYVFEEETTFQEGDSLIIGDYIHYFEGETTFYVDDTLYGYNILYSHNDTIVKLFFNSGAAVEYLGREYLQNSLSVAAWNLDTNTRDNMFDTKGFNCGLMEDYVIRYKMPVTENDKFYINSNMYNPIRYSKPAFWLALSIGDNYVEKIVSVADYTNNIVSNIYPNPATSRLTIDLNEVGRASVTIYNILGQTVLEETLQDISNNISIADLSSGLYFVKVNQNGKSHTVKISKE